MPEGLTVLLQFLEDFAHLEPHACLIWSYLLHMSTQFLSCSYIYAYHCKARLMLHIF